MKNWQKDRNYRKIENADGTFAYIITVDGTDVEVSEDVFKAYSQSDRRERYIAEQEQGQMLSLECMAEDNVQLEYLTDRRIESAEDTAIKEMLTGQAMTVLSSLSAEEQHLIRAVVMDGVSEKVYGDSTGISQVAVHKRKKRILKKIFSSMGY